MLSFNRAATVYISALFVVGCGESGVPIETIASDSEKRDVVLDAPSVQASTGFSWIVPGELAAMPLPGRVRPLDQDAAFLEQESIGVLVSLTEEPPDPETLASHSIAQEHLPIQDYAPPTQEQMTEFVTLVEDSVAAGTPVGVHCTAGLGRSGTMSAAYLVATGSSADEAITIIRELRPGSIETKAQEDAIRHFEEERGGPR